MFAVMERCPHTGVTGNGTAEYEDGRVKVKYDTGCFAYLTQHLHLVLPQSGFLGEIGYWVPMLRCRGAMLSPSIACVIN